MSYGERYIDLPRFIDYCKKLNVSVDERELEHYEKTGIMFPVARVVMPDDYVIASHRRIYEPDYIPSGNWPEVERLHDGPDPLNYAGLADEKLVDSFDREFGRNPCLFRPDGANYKPWNSYRVPVEHPTIPNYAQSSVTHYYAYWQIHQLYMVQKSPDLYENLSLLNLIPEDIKKSHWLPRAWNMDLYRSFRNLAPLFDALSFYITMSHREHRRTFASIESHHGLLTLSEDEHRLYLGRLSEHAKSVAKKYERTEEELFDFMISLLELIVEYQRAEGMKLSREIENDIGYLVEFIISYSGKDFRMISAKLSEKTTFWYFQAFRHINPDTKSRDEAKLVLSDYVNVYTNELSKHNLSSTTLSSFSDQRIDELLDFCNDNGLLILLHALGEIHIADDDPIRFWRVTRYTNLKNLATSFEYFLKAVGSKGFPQLPSTLTRVVRCMMKNEIGWYIFFNNNRQLVSGENSAAFVSNLETILNTDQFIKRTEETFWARHFLIACLARNMIVHTYPNEDVVYGDLFGIMIRAIIYCILYSWQVATREHWV